MTRLSGGTPGNGGATTCLRRLPNMPAAPATSTMLMSRNVHDVNRFKPLRVWKTAGCQPDACCWQAQLRLPSYAAHSATRRGGFAQSAGVAQPSPTGKACSFLPAPARVCMGSLHCRYTQYTPQELWGDAGQQYHQQYRLITGKQFKLALCAQDASQLPSDCQLPPDCPFSASELITLMLTCLRDHARQQLMESVGFDVDTAEVHYCLSVPAGM